MEDLDIPDLRTNPKHQIPNKKIKFNSLEILVIGIYLGFGFWDLGFRA
jgi:hypothetical protein